MLQGGIEQGSGTGPLPSGGSLPLPYRQTEAGGDGSTLSAESDLLNRGVFGHHGPELVLLQPVTCRVMIGFSVLSTQQGGRRRAVPLDSCILRD